jgi:hypothetical protein
MLLAQTGVQTRVFTGATRQSRRHAAANTHRPTEVTVSNDDSHTENGQTPLIFIHGAWLSARSWENDVYLVA